MQEILEKILQSEKSTATYDYEILSLEEPVLRRAFEEVGGITSARYQATASARNLAVPELGVECSPHPFFQDVAVVSSLRGGHGPQGLMALKP